MELKEDINYALKWVEECVFFNNGDEFLDYVYKFISDFLEIEKFKDYKNLSFVKTSFKVELRILGFSFIVINELYEVVIYKKNNISEEVIGKYLVPEQRYKIKGKNIESFHPMYLKILLEEAFNEFPKIAKEMRELEFYRIVKSDV